MVQLLRGRIKDGYGNINRMYRICLNRYHYHIKNLVSTAHKEKHGIEFASELFLGWP